MIMLTNAQVADLAVAAVAEKGEDYVYTDPVTGEKAGHYLEVGCVYVYDGKPQCLVGNILTRAGVDYDDLDRNLSFEVLYESRLKYDGILSISKEALDFLSRAQRRQDNGRTWGDAINTFETDFIGDYATKEA